MTVRYIGVDLAWSPRNTTGVVVLVPAAGRRGESGPLETRHVELLLTDDEILSSIEEDSGTGRVIVGIDAPIIAPNPPGTGRPADRQISRMFSRYHAGAYPANRERCARPIRLAQRLQEAGFTLSPREAAAGHSRCALEVYPHASAVAFFRLERIVKYKKGRVAQRRAGLTEWQELLHERLPTLEPSIVPFPRENPEELRGKALKGLEDRLDAVVCAATVAAFDQDPEAFDVVGSEEGGYILVPRIPVNRASPEPAGVGKV